MTDTPNTSNIDLHATAYHEAGHCVAALIYKLTVRYVTIILGKDAQGRARPGHTSIRRPKSLSSAEQRNKDVHADLKGIHANLIRYLAGPVCEARLIGKPVDASSMGMYRSEEHTSELQSLRHLVC